MLSRQLGRERRAGGGWADSGSRGGRWAADASGEGALGAMGLDGSRRSGSDNDTAFAETAGDAPSRLRRRLHSAQGRGKARHGASEERNPREAGGVADGRRRCNKEAGPDNCRRLDRAREQGGIRSPAAAATGIFHDGDSQGAFEPLGRERRLGTLGSAHGSADAASEAAAREDGRGGCRAARRAMAVTFSPLKTIATARTCATDGSSMMAFTNLTPNPHQIQHSDFSRPFCYFARSG